MIHDVDVKQMFRHARAQLDLVSRRTQDHTCGVSSANAVKSSSASAE
jgi:hypothetical protein